MSDRLPENEWLDVAACRDLNVDPAWFFPEAGDMVSYREALAVCRGCLVRQSCLDDDRQKGMTSVYGVRAGMPPKDRRGMRPGDPVPTAEQITARIAATRTVMARTPDTAPKPPKAAQVVVRVPVPAFRCECGRTFGTYGQLGAHAADIVAARIDPEGATAGQRAAFARHLHTERHPEAVAS